MVNNINQISLIWQYKVVVFVFVRIEMQAILKLNWNWTNMQKDSKGNTL